MSKTICLVDDDTSVRKALSRLLESAGIGVCAFATGEDFLSYAVSHPVSVVVLDIWMHQMNGLEVMVHLCSLSPQTRIIIITGREDFAVRSIATQVGAVAFLLKPFEDAEFLDKVQSSPSTHVIVLTANDDPSRRVTALNAGASAFLTKPCNYEEFSRPPDARLLRAEGTFEAVELGRIASANK